jgi:hypothetical protein
MKLYLVTVWMGAQLPAYRSLGGFPSLVWPSTRIEQ